MTVDDPGRVPRDKAARSAERARIHRLSRLPPFYDYAQRGRLQAVLATLVQAALAIALTLVPVKLVTGRWLPTGAALLVLAGAYGLQALSRYLNAKAGRR